MRKGSAFALILLLCSIWLFTFNVGAVKAESKTIVVPDDYATIQEAVDAASEGDTVFVKSGTYARAFRKRRFCGASGGI